MNWYFLLIVGYFKGSVPPSSIESMQDEVFFDYTLPTVLSSISDIERGIP